MDIKSWIYTIVLLYPSSCLERIFTDRYDADTSVAYLTFMRKESDRASRQCKNGTRDPDFALALFGGWWVKAVLVNFAFIERRADRWGSRSLIIRLSLHFARRKLSAGSRKESDHCGYQKQSRLRRRGYRTGSCEGRFVQAEQSQPFAGLVAPQWVEFERQQGSRPGGEVQRQELACSLQVTNTALIADLWALGCCSTRTMHHTCPSH